MTPFTEWRAELRQRRQHRAFRIPARTDSAWQEDLTRILAAVPEPPAPIEPEPAPEPEPELGTGSGPAPGNDPASEPVRAGAQLDDRRLAEAGTSLWRAMRRLERDDGPATARDRQTRRYLVACRDALTDAGLAIQDHDGDAFHAGRSIEVLVVQEDPALTREVVLETVRPTIYLHERRIQTGQVIVGGPASAGAPQPNSEVGDHAGQ